MIEIRRDRADDACAIWTAHEAAFGRPDEARVAAQLRQAASPLVSLVAEREGRVIGHVIFSPVIVEGDRTSPAVASLACGSLRAGAPFARAGQAELAAGALGPVGVLPDEQARGVGSALIRAGLDACRALDWRLLFVLGNPAYYGRFGFVPAAPHGLHYESHAFDAAFQLQELHTGALAGLSGWVRYHAAFAALG